MDTAFLDEINWIAAFGGGLAYFALGAIWYSKVMFASKWRRYVKIDPKAPGAKNGIGVTMFFSFLLVLLASMSIAIIRAKIGLNGGWMSGVKLGSVTGLGIGITAISNSYLYEKRPLGLHLINGGYTLVGNILAAVIICSWV